MPVLETPGLGLCFQPPPWEDWSISKGHATNCLVWVCEVTYRWQTLNDTLQLHGEARVPWLEAWPSGLVRMATELEAERFWDTPDSYRFDLRIVYRKGPWWPPLMGQPTSPQMQGCRLIRIRQKASMSHIHGHKRVLNNRLSRCEWRRWELRNVRCQLESVLFLCWLQEGLGPVGTKGELALPDVPRWQIHFPQLAIIFEMAKILNSINFI